MRDMTSVSSLTMRHILADTYGECRDNEQLCCESSAWHIAHPEVIPEPLPWHARSTFITTAITHSFPYGFSMALSLFPYVIVAVLPRRGIVSCGSYSVVHIAAKRICYFRRTR